jgi:hypothetical protein
MTDKNPKSLRENLDRIAADRYAQATAQPRKGDGKFAAKRGSAPESGLLPDDFSGSFNLASLNFGFQVPDLLTLEPSSSRNPITDPRLTGHAKTRLARLVEERGVTAIASSSPHDGTPVTMLYAGEDSIYTAGEAPKTTEEALAVIARAAAEGDDDSIEFLDSAFGDEADGLIETVSEEKLRG